jgi:hypothetical protein
MCELRNSVRSFNRYPALALSGVFMLTHGKKVRRVSFYPITLKALSGKALQRNAKVSFWLVFGNFLTFIDVKYSVYKFF